MKWVIALFLASPAAAFDVPSGQPVTLHEVIVDKTHGSDVRLRFRFVAPQVARDTGTVTYDQAEPDMQYLCEKTAIPYLTQYQLTGDQIVISLSDRLTKFGKDDPKATQFFEAYRVEGIHCILEIF